MELLQGPGVAGAEGACRFTVAQLATWPRIGTAADCSAKATPASPGHHCMAICPFLRAILFAPLLQAKATPANWGTGDKTFQEPMKDHTAALGVGLFFL